MRRFAPRRSLFILAAVLLFSAGGFASDEGGDPFPCEVVCVPIPVFPFLQCAPSCPGPGGPGGPGWLAEPTDGAVCAQDGEPVAP